LQIANQELQNANQSFKKYEQEQEKLHSKLKTQKNIWEIVAGLAVGYAMKSN